jgi:tetratricopeptide (TPR) repeat protein
MRKMGSTSGRFPGNGFCFGLLIVCLTTGALAQATMPCHAMGERDEIAPDKLPTPQKLEGIGNAHIDIRATPEAQMWFEQGLNLLHDFWDYESLQAFEQAVRADPNCAMCYWGIYQAEIFYHSNSSYYARRALEKAMGLRSHASKAERLYIEAGAAHEAANKAKDNPSSTPDKSPKEVDVWRRLVKLHPGDTQARVFLAEALIDGYDEQGEPRKGQKEALTLLQGVLRDDANGSAPNHYWIHAVEASPHPEQALHSAEILGSLAPTSGHMVHMPGHIFYRTGDYARAEAAFAASMRADESYMLAQHVSPDDDWNYVHNLMYAIANLMEEGKLTAATELSAKLAGARGELESTLYPWSSRDSISRLDPRLPVALRTGDWARALAMLSESKAAEGQPNLTFLAKQLTEFAKGMQAMEGGDAAAAERASAALDAGLWRFSQQVKDEAAKKDKDKNKDKEDADSKAPKLKLMPDGLPDPMVSNLSIMSLELRASLLAAKKQVAEATKMFEQAAQEEKALGYREPPSFIRPPGETEGAAMLAAADWKDAKSAYQRALGQRPRSGFSLYGIAACSEQGGESKTAVEEYKEFLAAWKDADSELPQMVHAREYVAKH